MTVEPTHPDTQAHPFRRAGTASAGWRGVLFGAMAVLSLHVTVVHFLHPGANPWYVGPLYVAGALAAWYNPVSAVFAFVVGVPLVHGSTIIWSDPWGSPYNVVFSGIYLTWFIKRVVVRRKSLSPSTGTGLLADVLSTAALGSLLVVFLGYPRGEMFPAVFSGIALDQRGLLYCVHATVVFTQGLFLYRLLDLERDAIRGHQAFARALLAIATIVIGFSLLQFVFDIPVWRGLILPGKRGLFSPFDDIHSYGSVIVLLFSVALFMALGGHGRSRIINGIAAFLLAWCAVFSLSRSTWVALLVVVLVAIWQFGRKWAVTATAGIVLAGVLAISLIQARDYRIPFAQLSTKDLSSFAWLGMRAHQWQVATTMIRDVPLSGTGIGSFLRLFPFYSNYDPALDGTGPWALRAPANAHDYYLQLGAELGLPALAVFLALLACACRSAFRRMAAEPAARPLVKGVMAGVGAYLLTCLTGHPLLLPVQQFVFWFAIAALTIAPNSSSEPSSLRLGRFSRVGLALLCAVMIAGYSYRAYALPESIGYTYGLYPVERSGFAWTRKDARLQVMATSDLIQLRMNTNRRNIGGGGLGLTVSVNGREVDQRTLFTAGMHQFAYYVSGIANRNTTIQLSVSRTFNPSELGLSGNSRELGVALAPITFLPELPPDGVGFYTWETGETSGLPSAIRDSAVPYRWTQRQATVPLQNRASDTPLIMLLYASHPDIRSKPVSVELLGDSRLLRTVALDEAAWKQIEIPAEAIRAVRALTLRVDRTWNPRRAGVSADSRDLGVAVILR